MLYQIEKMSVYYIWCDLPSYEEKFYIGSTLYCPYDLNIRLSAHKTCARKGMNSKLYNAMRELGVDRFRIDVLEYKRNISVRELREREDHYIREFNSIAEGWNTNYAIKSLERRREAVKRCIARYYKTINGKQKFLESSRRQYKKKKEAKENLMLLSYLSSDYCS
jgi:group I intron endonuclease